MTDLTSRREIRHEIFKAIQLGLSSPLGEVKFEEIKWDNFAKCVTLQVLWKGRNRYFTVHVRESI